MGALLYFLGELLYFLGGFLYILGGFLYFLGGKTMGELLYFLGEFLYFLGEKKWGQFCIFWGNFCHFLGEFLYFLGAFLILSLIPPPLKVAIKVINSHVIKVFHGGVVFESLWYLIFLAKFEIASLRKQLLKQIQ